MTEHTPIAWAELTAVAAKQRLYADDGFFREGLADLRHLNGVPIEPVLRRTALVLYKPEAIGGRRVMLADRLLSDSGFAAVAAAGLEFTGPTIQGLWRYQLRRNTLDKIRLYTRWATRAPALLVAYRDIVSETDLPAAVRLKGIKGPAAIHKRQPHDLRSRLGSPNSILNFLHSADEPVDIVREIAVLLPCQERDGFIRNLLTGDCKVGSDQLARLVRRAHRRTGPHDVTPDASAERLRKFAEAHAGVNPTAAEHVVASIDQALSGEANLNLRPFEDALDALGSPDPLDVFVFGTQFIERDRDGQVGELDEDCVPAWRARLARHEAEKGCPHHA
jgi:hypothetical protein